MCGGIELELELALEIGEGDGDNELDEVLRRSKRARCEVGLLLLLEVKSLLVVEGGGGGLEVDVGVGHGCLVDKAADCAEADALVSTFGGLEMLGLRACVVGGAGVNSIFFTDVVFGASVS